WGNGVWGEGMARFVQGLGIVPLHDKQVAIPLVGSGIVGIQLDGAAQFLIRGGEVPISHGHVAEDGMSFGKPGIELESFLRGLARLCYGLAGRHSVYRHLPEKR